MLIVLCRWSFVPSTRSSSADGKSCEFGIGEVIGVMQVHASFEALRTGSGNFDTEKTCEAEFPSKSICPCAQIVTPFKTHTLRSSSH